MTPAMSYEEARAYEVLLKKGQIPGRHAMTPAQKATYVRFDAYVKQRETAAWTLAAHAAAALCKSGRPTTENQEMNTAVKWLKLGHDLKSSMAWIDRVIADHVARGKLPPRSSRSFPLRTARPQRRRRR